MDEFFTQVCAPHGLKRYAGRLQGAGRQRAAAAVITALERRQDPLLQSAVWALVRKRIDAEPAPFAEILGIDVSIPAKPRRQRTMTEIFTSPGKGPKREPDTRNPIGFASRPAEALEIEHHAL